MDQPQRLVEGETSGLRLGLVEIVPANFDGAKERMNVLGPRGMAFFPGPAGIVRHAQVRLVV